MMPNVLQLGEVADLEVLTFNLALNRHFAKLLAEVSLFKFNVDYEIMWDIKMFTKFFRFDI